MSSCVGKTPTITASIVCEHEWLRRERPGPLLNPGPYLTGFNDRMADSMWEWFGDESLNAPATPLFQMMREFVTTGQRDPAEVVTRMVELTEAETTTENNFVPPDILGQVAAQAGT